MGVIYYKNKQYAGGGGSTSSSSEHIELTYEKYITLSEEEQKNGTVYFITDVEEVPTGVKVVTELSDSVTDKQIPSAKVVYNEVNNRQKKYNISSEGIIATLDSTSTYPYVCTEDCLMNVTRLACVEGTSGVILRVNGIAIATGSSSTVYSNLVCPLCKGDSVYFDNISTLHAQTRIRIIKQKDS